MAPSDTKSWAEEFAAELVVDGEHIPFERVLARHLDAVTKLRQSSRHTWPGIASILVRGGARRADGGLISADQIRVGYSRLVRHVLSESSQRRELDRGTAESSDNRSPRLKPPLRSHQPPRHGLLTGSKPTRSLTIQPTFSSSPDEDISGDDIQLALERLNKLNQK
jgi:hypothetical protein